MRIKTFRSRPNGAQHVSLGQVNPRRRMNAAPGELNRRAVGRQPSVSALRVSPCLFSGTSTSEKNRRDTDSLRYTARRGSCGPSSRNTIDIVLSGREPE